MNDIIATIIGIVRKNKIRLLNYEYHQMYVWQETNNRLRSLYQYGFFINKRYWHDWHDEWWQNDCVNDCVARYIYNFCNRKYQGKLPKNY